MKLCKSHFVALVAVVGGLASVPGVHAQQVVLSDDFESYGEGPFKAQGSEVFRNFETLDPSALIVVTEGREGKTAALKLSATYNPGMNLAGVGFFVANQPDGANTSEQRSDYLLSFDLATEGDTVLRTGELCVDVLAKDSKTAVVLKPEIGSLAAKDGFKRITVRLDKNPGNFFDLPLLEPTSVTYVIRFVLIGNRNWTGEKSILVDNVKIELSPEEKGQH